MKMGPNVRLRGR